MTQTGSIPYTDRTSEPPYSAQEASGKAEGSLAEAGRIKPTLPEALDEKHLRQGNDEERQPVEQGLNQESLALENARLAEQNVQLLKALAHDRQCFAETYQRMQKQAQAERDLLLAESASFYHASVQIAAAQTYTGILAALCDHTFLGKGEINVAIHIFDHPWTDGRIPEWIFLIDRYSQVNKEASPPSFRLASSPSASQFLRPDTPIFISSVGNDPRLDQAMRKFLIARYNARSALIVPLVAAAHWIGYILGAYQQTAKISENEIRQLMILAGHAASAVQNLCLLEETRRYEEAFQADPAKDNFLEYINDELSTPLKSIIGFSRLIMNGMDGPITPRQKEDLTAIQNSGQHLLNRINDLLDLSKIESGNFQLSLDERVSLNDLINSLKPAWTNFINNKRGELRLDLPANLPLIHADTTRIRQVLIHLLSNVTRFAEESPIFVKASVQAGPTGQPEIMILVGDTKTGSDDEDQEEVFKAFSQDYTSSNHKTGGSLLGLSICRHLIEMHGGRTGYKSEPGHGSAFYFTLPVSKPEH